MAILSGSECTPVEAKISRIFLWKVRSVTVEAGSGSPVASHGEGSMSCLPFSHDRIYAHVISARGNRIKVRALIVWARVSRRRDGFAGGGG